MLTALSPETTVVGVHGQPGAASDFASAFALLPDYVDAVALDRPGYGANPLPPSSIDDNARWLVAELERVDAQHVVLVGHSYGGGIAIAAAAMAPERISGLVLLASIGPESLAWWDTMLAAPVVGPAITYSGLSLLPRVAGRLAPRLVRTGKITVGPWRTFLAEQRELVRNLDTVNARLADVAVPTVILTDPADPVVPVATADVLHAAITGSRLEYVTGGHDLPARNPDAVATAVESLFIGARR